MENSKCNDEKPKIRKIISSGLLMLLTIFVLVYSSIAWFSYNRLVSPNEANLSVADTVDFTVTAKSDAEDEALTYTYVETADDGERLLRLYADDNVTAISPGSSGEFSFWVSAPKTSSIIVTPTVCAGGIIATKDTSGNILSVAAANAYRDISTPDEQTRANGYMQGHILLFTDKSGGVYSGWIDPTDGKSLALADSIGTKTGFTIYWVWVDSYRKFTSEGLISSDDLQKIKAKNFESGVYNEYAAEHLFDSRGNTVDNPSDTLLSHYYDFGDEDIGTAVDHLYFNLKFSA